MRSEHEELKELIGMLFLKIDELESKIDAKEVRITYDPPFIPDTNPLHPPANPYPWGTHPHGPFWTTPPSSIGNNPITCGETKWNH